VLGSCRTVLHITLVYYRFDVYSMPKIADEEEPVVKRMQLRVMWKYT